MGTENISKRQAIENEIRNIVLSGNRAILRDNLRRRRMRLGDLKKGDDVILCEYFRKRRKDPDEDADLLYRIVEGRIIQTTRSGFFIEGITARGNTVREYVNKAHIISGSVRLVAKE